MKDLPRVIAWDPPWQPKDKLPGPARGAGRNYQTMSVEEICRYPLPQLHPDALMFLWRLSAMQEEALQVVRAKGFRPVSEVVWDKLTKHGEPWFGMGRYVRASHETAIIAVRGRPRIASRSVRSRFDASVPTDARGRYIHSAKPEYFYRLIVERLSPGPYLELFARRRRTGWTCRGDIAG